MALQKESKNPYYTLGRIVAYREKEGKLTGTSDLVEKILLDIQEGTALKLANLAQQIQANTRGLEDGKKEEFEALEMEIAKLHDRLEMEEYPERMNPEQLGSFQLGYYHQRSVAK
jgi:hypothetical protein